MKTKLQIITETAKYYGDDPSCRAVDGDRCHYLDSDGKKCAIGRVSKIPKALECIGGTIDDVIEDNYSDKQIFQKEYQGHSTGFWQDLQIFHDRDDYWTKTGLSAKGKLKLQSLKKKYA